MKVYKATNKDMQCTPNGKIFQYEQGVTYEKPEAELCRHGFHACEAPMDVLRYYSPADGSRYFEAELEDILPERSSEDTKVCGKKITIGAEIGIPGLAKAHVEYVKHLCEKATEQTASGVRGNAAASGGSGNAAASGGSGNAAASGVRGNAAASGESGNAAASGWSGNAAASGGSGNAAASGWSGNAAASGGSGNAAASGVRGNAAASGVRGTAAASGSYGSAEANGEQTIAVAWGSYSKARGKTGSYIVCAEYDERNKTIKTARLGLIDGETLKPDTWYTLKGGDFVEVSP